MKRTVTVIVCLALSLLLTAPAAAADRQEVKFGERDVEVLKAKPPQPEVTYLLVRTKLEQPVSRPAVKLAPRIERALDAAPF